jgi:hypothetical protein
VISYFILGICLELYPTNTDGGQLRSFALICNIASKCDGRFLSVNIDGVMPVAFNAPGLGTTHGKSRQRISKQRRVTTPRWNTPSSGAFPLPSVAL